LNLRPPRYIGTLYEVSLFYDTFFILNFVEEKFERVTGSKSFPEENQGMELNHPKPK